MKSKAKKSTVLVIEDEVDISELICQTLSRANYDVLQAANGYEGLQLAAQQRPEAVIIDLMLARMGGFEVVKRLKGDALTSDILIMILSAKTELESRIHGFELGVDDYMTKPFSPRELVLRLQSVLRRRHPVMDTLVAGDLILDPMALKVTLHGHFLDLSLIEFKLLSLLMAKAGDTLSREELLSEIWGREASVSKRAVDTNIYRLREKLEDHGGMMRTVRGVGYTFSNSARAVISTFPERGAEVGTHEQVRIGLSARI